jgi:transposase
MPRALSLDLRVRVLAAVAKGLSHRQAGERFGVSAASVSRWRSLERERGEADPRSQGGDRRSGRVEAHGATILALVEETPDIAIEELRRTLADKGLVFGYGTIRRFFARHAITRKKRPRTPASRIGRISGSAARPGSRSSSISIPSVSSLSMRPGPRPAWPERTAVAAAASDCVSASPTAIGKPRPSSLG